MNYYSLPFTPKPGKQYTLPKVNAEESVRQHIRLLLTTMPGSYWFSPVYGSSLNKNHFLLPDRRKGEKRLEQELKLKLQENLRLLIGKYEPRLAVEDIEVGISFTSEEEKLKIKNDSRLTFKINITGSIEGEGSFRHQEEFLLK